MSEIKIATAPAGTLIKIDGAGFLLVDDTLISGATPWPLKDYFSKRDSRENHESNVPSPPPQAKSAPSSISETVTTDSFLQ